MEKMELVVKIEGGLITNDNAKEYADYYRHMMSLQEASNMKTDEDFKGGADFIKGLSEDQKKIKIMKDYLVNGKAEEVMKILDDLNGEIASKKSEFKKEIDVRKNTIKYNIIKEAYLKCNPKYKAKIIEECEEVFKGKSSFENMGKDGEKICEKYQNQYKQDEIKIKEMTTAYRAVDFKYNKDTRPELIALSVETYFKQGKDADFVTLDLSNKYMEEEKKERDEAEKIRLDNETKQNEAKETQNQAEPEQAEMMIEHDAETGEIIEEKPQETLDNKGVECYSNSVEIPKKNTYFLVKYKQIKDETQVVIYAGLNKENIEKCGSLVFLNEEFIDFKALFPANDYVDLNNNQKENL